ncbi:hypothetical protein SNE40_013120 [Patella caerulea]|uniref:Uncharacterized protein n=1 Tax=Patella caerulea TaxID=87958 RepID=A0AAN8JHI4_PATCE
MGDDVAYGDDVFDCDFEDSSDLNKVSGVPSGSATGNNLTTVPKEKRKKKINQSKIHKVQKIKSKSDSLKLSQVIVSLISESVMRGTRLKSSRKNAPNS